MKEVNDNNVFISEKGQFEKMRIDFCELFESAKQNEAKILFEEITRTYSSEIRKYHNLQHLEKMLLFISSYKKEINDVISLKLAIYFHDFVYDTMADDNENQSANYAKKVLLSLGIVDHIVERVVMMIRATAKHQADSLDRDLKIFLDADLAVLGAEAMEYDQYVQQIRQEYFWLSDEQFSIGRKQVLIKFLERPRIYLTDFAYNNLEKQARENITRELLRY